MKSKFTLWSAVIALCFTLIGPTVARAQEGDSDLSKEWTLRLGTFIANSQTTRSKMGTFAIAGYADRTVFDGEKYKLTVGFGYVGGENFYSVPIMLNAVWKHNKMYFGGGFGYAFGKRLDGRPMGAISLDALVGTQLNTGKNALSAELRYSFIGGSDNELDGLSVTLGMHL